MAKASYDFGSVKKQAQADADRKSGGKLERMKLTKDKNYVLVLPPYKKGTLYKRVMVHQVWKGGKPILTVTCGRAQDGNDCPVCDYGFKTKDKFADSSSESKQNLWKNFMPTNDVQVNALQLKKTSKGWKTDGVPKILKLPNDGVELLLSEIDESADGMDIFGLDDGRPMYIKGNGIDGKKRRYPVIKFTKEPANLVDEGLVDEDEVLEGLVDLDKLEPKFNEKKLQSMLRKLKGKDMEDDEDEDEEFEESEDDDKDDEVDASEDDDDDDFEDDDDDDEVEDDDDDEVEDDDDDDDIEDDDDDDDEDEKPAKRSKKKSSKAKSTKSKSSKKKTSKKKGLRKKR